VRRRAAMPKVVVEEGASSGGDKLATRRRSAGGERKEEGEKAHRLSDAARRRDILFRPLPAILHANRRTLKLFHHRRTRCQLCPRFDNLQLRRSRPTFFHLPHRKASLRSQQHTRSGRKGDVVVGLSRRWGARLFALYSIHSVCRVDGRKRVIEGREGRRVEWRVVGSAINFGSAGGRGGRRRWRRKRRPEGDGDGRKIGLELGKVEGGRGRSSRLLDFDRSASPRRRRLLLETPLFLTAETTAFRRLSAHHARRRLRARTREDGTTVRGGEHEEGRERFVE
jgi:hypothetical protein